MLAGNWNLQRKSNLKCALMLLNATHCCGGETHPSQGRLYKLGPFQVWPGTQHGQKAVDAINLRPNVIQIQIWGLWKILFSRLNRSSSGMQITLRKHDQQQLQVSQLSHSKVGLTEVAIRVSCPGMCATFVAAALLLEVGRPALMISATLIMLQLLCCCMQCRGHYATAQACEAGA